MRLLVGDHLQAMFDAPEKDIGLGELVNRLARHPALDEQLFEHLEGARAAQTWPPSAENELLRLNEELDLANASAAELDVVARHGDDFMAAHGMDLALHRVDVGDRGVVEILAPDERGEIAQKGFAQRNVAGDRTRLDHRGALPVLPEAFVVGGGARESTAQSASRRGRDAAADRRAARSRRACAPAAGAPAP